LLIGDVARAPVAEADFGYLLAFDNDDADAVRRANVVNARALCNVHVQLRWLACWVARGYTVVAMICVAGASRHQRKAPRPPGRGVPVFSPSPRWVVRLRGSMRPYACIPVPRP